MDSESPHNSDLDGMHNGLFHLHDTIDGNTADIIALFHFKSSRHPTQTVARRQLPIVCQIHADTRERLSEKTPLPHDGLRLNRRVTRDVHFGFNFAVTPHEPATDTAVPKRPFSKIPQQCNISDRKEIFDISVCANRFSRNGTERLVEFEFPRKIPKLNAEKQALFRLRRPEFKRTRPGTFEALLYTRAFGIRRNV